MASLVEVPRFGDDQEFVDGVQISQHGVDVTEIGGAAGQQAQALHQQQNDQAMRPVRPDLLVDPVLHRLPSGMVRAVGLADHGSQQPLRQPSAQLGHGGRDRQVHGGRTQGDRGAGQRPTWLRRSSSTEKEARICATGPVCFPLPRAGPRLPGRPAATHRSSR